MIGQNAEVPQVVRIEEGVFFRQGLEPIFEKTGCAKKKKGEQSPTVFELSLTFHSARGLVVAEEAAVLLAAVHKGIGLVIGARLKKSHVAR
jgi:hypothetical protein